MEFSTDFFESLRSQLPDSKLSDPSTGPRLLNSESRTSTATRFETLYTQSRTVETQDERRKRLLQELRTKKRDDILVKRYAIQWGGVDAAIGLNEEYMDYLSDGSVEHDTTVSSSVGSKKRSRDRVPRLMLSEWLIEVPEDFEENWNMIVCPNGKRSSLLASTGRTVAFSRSGLHLFTGYSNLPGGNAKQPGKECLTVLDCVFSNPLKTFFILDVLFWNGSSLMEHGVEFRNFWLRSRFSEMDSRTISTGDQEFSLSLLPSHKCEPGCLSQTFSKITVPYPVDGFLFYHKEGIYVPETTPFVLWLKPYMIPEILKMPISAEFEQKPCDYVSLHDSISKKELNKEKKPRGKKKRQSTTQGNK